MWRTPPEMRHWYQHIHSFPIISVTIVKSSCPIFTPVDSPEPVYRATELSAQRGFPRNTGLRESPRIALSGSGKPPMYVPRTSLSLYIYMPASAIFHPGLYCSTMCSSGQTHFSPQYPLQITRMKYTINTLNSNNSRNYINPRNTLVHMNTITRRLYHIYKTRPHSTRTNVQLPDSTRQRKRPPPVKAAVSYDDNARSLGDPGPLSTICFVYSIQFSPP